MKAADKKTLKSVKEKICNKIIKKAKFAKKKQLLVNK